MTQQTKRVEAYTFVEFCKELQSAIQEGYAIDFNDNASIPSGGIGYYKSVLYKGPKIAALLKAPADKESFEADLEKIEEKFVEFDKQVDEAIYPGGQKEPFVPSVVFEVKEGKTNGFDAKEPEKKPKGRPKASQV